MTQAASVRGWRSRGVMGALAIVPLLSGMLLGGRAIAQITPDATLDSEASVVSPNAAVRGLPADLIQGGATRGVNLFHSFSQFNVSDGQRVYFANPSGIENILSRVTGADPSRIFGTLGVNGTANLFFLNPNGIIFGPNARLDVAGSFVGSTASSFKFPDGSEFSATNPQAPPLLTINVPMGLQYGRPVGNIQQAGNLAVPAGQSLILYGNQVTNTGTLSAAGGTVQVLGDRVSLLDQAAIDVSSSTGGGTVLIGGDFQGNGTIPTATQTFIGPNVTINADGISPPHSSLPAHGGKVIVWSNDNTEFYGTISARGGTQAGDGGFVEISGSKLTFQGLVDTTATAGKTGTLLLDPDNITIGFTSTIPGDQLIDPNVLATALNTNSVTLAATNTINVTGNVIANSPNDLTLQARDIAFTNAFVLQLGGGSIILDTTQNTGTSSQTTQGTSVSVNGGAIGTLVLTGATNNAGNIEITTGSLTVNNGGQLLANTFGIGDAGNVKLNVSGFATFDGVSPDGQSVSAASSQVGLGATGKGGNVELTAGSLIVTNGAQLSATTFGTGDAGSVKLIVNGSAAFNGVSPDGRFVSSAGSQVAPGATGKGGNVELSADSLIVTNGAQLDASTFGIGDTGSVKLTIRDAAIFDGISPDGRFVSAVGSTVGLGALGKGGSIELSADSLTVTNGAQLLANTYGNGDAGSVKLIVRGAATFNGASSDGRFISGVGSLVATDAIGKGGSIELSAGSLTMTNGARLSASTFGRGDAGSVRLTVRDAAIFDGVSPDGRFVSGAGSVSGLGATGKGGSIELSTGSLTVTNGAGLSASTFGSGDAGSVKLTVINTAIFDGVSPDGQSGSSAASTVNLGATGKGGSVELSAGSLAVTNGASLNASTFGTGSAGDVKLIVIGNTIFDGTTPDGRFVSGAFSAVNSGATGRGGNVELITRSLSITNGAALNASTAGIGDAGNVKLTIAEAASFDGISFNGRFSSGAFSTVEPGAIGKGGNVELTAGSLTIRNRAAISASTSGQGDGGGLIIRAGSVQLANQAVLAAFSLGQGDAGNIDVTAGSIRLDNQAFISTATTSGQGGNIVLNVDKLLLLRRSSQITTTAGIAQAGGDGGNITINAPRGFIVGVLSENSDITANAFTGNGGRVNITAQGIYGLQFQPKLTPFSDITASSQFGFSGVVTLNTPDVDPNRGLVQLPGNPVDPSQQIDQSCVPGSRQSRGRFVVTGRGGIPASPTEPLQDETVLTEWVMVQGGGDGEMGRWGDGARRDTEEGRTTQSTIQNLQSKIPTPHTPIIEAQGWIVDTDGTVYLVAATPESVAHSNWQPSVRCPEP